MCTLLLRFAPGERWPLLAAAVRDEFADRPWDPPARHWPGACSHLVGGRDRTAGGTWLAVDPGPGRPALAALLNGARLGPPASGPRPTRGTLALDALTGGAPTEASQLAGYDGFHLVVGGLDGVEVWSWDGECLDHRHLQVGDHVIVNGGPDTGADPLVARLAPLLAAVPSPQPDAGLSTADAWGEWVELLSDRCVEPSDPAALVKRKEVEGRTYASTSASLVALSAGGVRYDFNADPRDRDGWFEVGAAAIRTGGRVD